MSRIFFGLAAACVLTLGLAGAAQARPAHGRAHGRVAHRAVNARRVVRSHGVRFSPTWRRVYSPAYKRYQYFDSAAHCWYCYDSARLGYFPCS
jgi:hypothetical protein